MWRKTETDLMVDIQPRGEEDRHIVGKEMFVHRTFEGSQGFLSR